MLELREFEKGDWMCWAGAEEWTDGGVAREPVIGRQDGWTAVVDASGIELSWADSDQEVVWKLEDECEESAKRCARLLGLLLKGKLPADVETALDELDFFRI